MNSERYEETHIEELRQSLIDNLQEVFNDRKKASEWMNTPNEEFDMNTPNDLLLSKEGYDSVLLGIDNLKND